MDRFFLHKIKIVLVFLYTFLGVQLVNSQTIERPRRDPTSSRICASLGNSTFDIISGFSANTFSSSNIFSLELSDVNGSFDNSTVVGTSGTDNTTLELRFSIDFSQFIEPYEGSDNYKLRVVSSEFPDSLSQSLTIPIFYIDDTVLDTELSILCDSGTIYAIPDDFDEYIWYKADLDGGNVTLLSGETSNTLEVTELGRYYFIIDIGECNQTASVGAAATSNFASVESDNGINVSISGATTRTGCSDESIVLESSTTDPSFSYQWYKGNEELEDGGDSTFTISGSGTSTLTVTGVGMEGDYRLAASNGFIGDCTSQSDPVDIELLNPKISITSETTVLLLPPGEPKTLTSQIIRGIDPRTITWFRIPPNETTPQPVPGGNTESIQVVDPGTYYVRLEANSPCPQDNTVESEEQVQVVPAENLDITIAHQDSNYQNCEFSQTVLEVREVTATVNGELVVLDEAALQSIVVDWQRDGVSTGETGRTISINNASENGLYRAVIEGEASSNLSVILVLDSFVITKTPEELPLDGELELSLGLQDATGYGFQWIRNNQVIPNANNQTYVTTEPGVYTVQVSFSPCDPETLPPVTVTTGSPVIPGVITPNGDGINDDWVLPFDFTQQANVEINVYASNGELDYSTVNYNGEWPQESKSKAVGTVYYYVINVDNNPVEQGSITIIR